VDIVGWVMPVSSLIQALQVIILDQALQVLVVVVVVEVEVEVVLVVLVVEVVALAVVTGLVAIVCWVLLVVLHTRANRDLPKLKRMFRLNHHLHHHQLQLVPLLHELQYQEVPILLLLTENMMLNHKHITNGLSKREERHGCFARFWSLSLLICGV